MKNQVESDAAKLHRTQPRGYLILHSSLFGNPQQTYCCKHRADAKDDEDEHRDGVVDARRSGVGINDLANPNRHEEKAKILDVVDDAIGGAELL